MVGWWGFLEIRFSWVLVYFFWSGIGFGGSLFVLVGLFTDWDGVLEGTPLAHISGHG
jgi:hypothetical protein